MDSLPVESPVAWARELLAIAQNGLYFCKDDYDQIRYRRVREIGVAILAEHMSWSAAQIHDLQLKEKGYATPKIGVRAVVFREGRILLVRERSDGLWTLPGGWCDIGDSPTEAVERELFEESGYHGRANKLLALFDQTKHDHPPYPFQVFKLFFRCEITGGQPQPSNETSEIAFFDSDSIPELSPHRVIPSQIKRMFEHLSHPDWPTDFD